MIEFKRIATALCALLLAGSISIYAQGVKGWQVAPLPAVSYSSDLGLQYGLCADIYNYGKGDLFPDFKDHFYVEASRFTKGQTLLHLQYDSDKLIKGVRLSGALSYQYDPLFYLYGVNGAEAYVPELDLNPETGTARYSYQRTMVRGLLDALVPINSNFGWIAGASFYKMGQQDHRITDKYDISTSLYNQYVATGLIPSDQADGGAVIEAKAGLYYDTRDLPAAPNKGIQAEVFLNGSPGILSPDSAYLKLAARWRQFISLVPGNLVFAYQLAYQGTIAGETPFYMLPIIYNVYLRQTTNEGLGGCATLRGLLQNRMMGQSYAWANFEMRWKIVSFKVLGQDVYFGINPLFDAGYITKLYRPEATKAFYSAVDPADYERFNCSAGMGLKLAINENMIISFEGAQVLGHQEYPLGTVILLNYIF